MSTTTETNYKDFDAAVTRMVRALKMSNLI